MNKQTWVKLAGTVAVMVALVWLLVEKGGVSQESFLEAFRNFGPWHLAVVFLGSFLQIFFMILRLWFLTPRERGWKFFPVMFAVAFGHAVNMFLPAKAGEAVKLVFLSRTGRVEQRSLLTGMGVLIADRISDLLGLVTLVLASGVLFLPQFGWAPGQSGFETALVALLVGVLAVGVLWWVERRFAIFTRLMAKFRDGLAGLRPTQLAPSVVFSFGAWAVEAWVLQWLAQAQGFPLSFAQATFVLVVLNLAILLPVSLANIGTFEAGVVAGLRAFAVPTANAVAVAAAHHAMQLVAVATWAGFVLAWRRWGYRGDADFARDLSGAVKEARILDEDLAQRAQQTAATEEFAAVLEVLELTPGISVLDVRCGDGAYSITAKESGARVYACDRSTGPVMRLSEIVDETEVASPEYLELDKRFDRVVAVEALEDAEDPHRAFERVCGYVEQGGRLVAVVRDGGTIPFWEKLEGRLVGRPSGRYAVSELREIAQRAGLQPVTERILEDSRYLLAFRR